MIIKTLTILAWRNVWRNKRRTIITTASIVFAVVFACIMRSVHLGSWDNIIDNVINSYTGYVQIHKKGYWKNKLIDKSIEYNSSFLEILPKDENIRSIVPRLESVALASFGTKTKGIALIGVNPYEEIQMTKLDKKLVKGTFFNENDNGVLVADGLANYMNIRIGDTLVLMGQGYHGTSAFGVFLVQGILKFATPEYNNQLVYVSLKTAQDFLGTGNRVTTIVLNISNKKAVDPIIAQLEEKLDPMVFEVMKWDEVLTELLQQFNTDNTGGLIMLGILYIIIGFGIFGTILMMTSERRREFSIMVAIGMKKSRIIIMVIQELVLIIIMGITIGLLISLPVLVYLNHHPIVLTGEAAKSFEQFGLEAIMPASLDPAIFMAQAKTILFISIFACIIPIYKISGLKIIKALR